MFKAVRILHRKDAKESLLVSNEEGEILTNERDKVKRITDFFKQTFTSEIVTTFPHIELGIQKCPWKEGTKCWLKFAKGGKNLEKMGPFFKAAPPHSHDIFNNMNPVDACRKGWKLFFCRFNQEREIIWPTFDLIFNEKVGKNEKFKV